MKNFKKVAAVVITAVAITGSASALASASSAKSKSGSIVNFKNMDANKSKGMKGMRGDHFGPGNKEEVITSTLGIDSATLRSRLAAGETLAAIAGAKKDALIAALVAEHVKRIDADVAAGRLTADQAKTMKENVTAHVTEEINEVHTPGMGGKGQRGDRDGRGERGERGERHGHGPGHDHGMGGQGLPGGSTNGIPNTSNSNN